MGTDTKSKSSSSTDIKPREEINPDQEPSQELDERDLIEPLNEAPPESGDGQEGDETETPGDVKVVEQEITLDEDDNQPADVSDSDEVEIDLNGSGKEPEEPLEPDEPQEAQPEETADAEEPDDPEENTEDTPEDITSDDDPAGDDESPDESESSNEDSENEEAVDEGGNDFVALTDDEVDDDVSSKSEEGESPAENAEVPMNKTPKHDGKIVSAGDPCLDIKKSATKKIVPLKTASDSLQVKTTAKGSARARKVIAAAVSTLIIAGYAAYNNPALVGLGKEKEPVSLVDDTPKKSVEPAPVQVQKPRPVGKQQPYLSKLNEVDRLREMLLAKKEEIYRLKLHYRNGIADLQDQSTREIREKGISTLDQALNNKRIELNLRTIQRRYNYIHELEKPDRWAHQGSEELLFLKRRAELDLQMVDVASGIDLDRQMRYINAAIQKYQPSAEKLAVDPLPLESTPMEAVWDQINQRQADRAPATVGPEDQNIISEICSGNFKRIAKLSTITPDAARCLSQVKSPDLFLNGLTRVSPDDAKYLFQWQGNWICLNSIKELSPAAAKYLFKWDGKWISLNGLTEFPPELAVYLMEWKGNQLELMGLKYDRSKPDRKALKYLALWETMGGKLYISKGVRKEMDRLM
jgi:hypothetical protein